MLATIEQMLKHLDEVSGDPDAVAYVYPVVTSPGLSCLTCPTAPVGHRRVSTRWCRGHIGAHAVGANVKMFLRQRLSTGNFCQ
jgi:hypothetical protein